ncbi:MAG: D-alanyl-D-alanine carboxypeptidase [Clostridia bacterium]|nr:D-alanyl-D-alanine carboxypeptidase [Clostridia bacterium]
MKLFKTAKRIISVIMAAAMMLAVMPFGAKAADEPEILSSESAMLYCIESDTVLFTHNSDATVKPGVLIKLMVALVAIEEVENRGMTIDSTFTASSRAIRNTRGKHIGMKSGEVFRLRDLIAAMLHADADDAAHVIAEGIADTNSNFVKLMNQKAADLGMVNTQYFSVTGTEDEESYTTAADQMLLASYAIKLQSLTEIGAETRAVIPKTNKSSARYYGTTNYLISTRVNPDYYMKSATGLIAGNQTIAGYCAVLTSRRDGLNYVAVITGAGTTRVLVHEEYETTDENGDQVVVPAEYKTIYHGLNEGKALLKWGENRFGYVKAVNSATPIADIPVKLASGSDRVALMPQRDLEIFVSDDVDLQKDVSYHYVLNSKSLTAPVKAGQVVGTLYVTYKGEKIGEVPLVTRNNIEQDGWLTIGKRIKELVSTPFFIVLMILTAFAALFYVISTAVVRQKKENEKKRQKLASREHRYLGQGNKK